MMLHLPSFEGERPLLQHRPQFLVRALESERLDDVSVALPNPSLQLRANQNDFKPVARPFRLGDNQAFNISDDFVRGGRSIPCFVENDEALFVVVPLGEQNGVRVCPDAGVVRGMDANILLWIETGVIQLDRTTAEGFVEIVTSEEAPERGGAFAVRQKQQERLHPSTPQREEFRG